MFIVDKSGSMYPLTSDTIGGYNSVLEQQRGKEGEVLVTTYLFSSEHEKICDRVSIDKTEPMTEEQYVPGGMTALVDTLGEAIAYIQSEQGKMPEEEVPEHTMFVVITDGKENASREYTAGVVREAVRTKREKDGWEFLFLGANIDAVETAASYGIQASNAVNYKSDRVGTHVVYETVSKGISLLRKDKRLEESSKWREEADEDFRSRS